MDFFDTQHASLDSGMGSDNDSQLVRVWREKEELERKLNSMLDQQKGSRSSTLSRPPSLGSPTNNNLVHGIQETLQNLVCQLEQFGQKFDALTTRVDEMEQKIHELQGTRQTVTLLQNNLVAKSLDLSEMTSRLELVERAQRGAATHSDLVKRKKILEQGGTNPLLVEKKQIPRKHSFPLARSTLEEPRPIFSRKIREKYEDRPTRKTSVPTRRLEQMSTPSSGGLRGVSSWSSFTAPRARIAGTGGENSGEEAVVALFFHNTDSPSGLSFELGDQLEIAGRTGEEFSMARNSQGQTGFIPNKLVQRVLPLDRSSWFYGNLQEAEVETLLSAAIPGDFLVRITPENQYILGLKGKTKVHHIPVPIVNGKVEMGGRSFANVPCMITYYLFSKVPIVFGEHLKRPLLK